MKRITLLWPASALWQNRRHHWADRTRATKEARRWAWAAAKEARVESNPNAYLKFTFHPPTKRLPDMQNMPATQKAAIDGIADAMQVDDSGFRCIWPLEFAEPVKGGSVIVEIFNELEHRGTIT